MAQGPGSTARLGARAVEGIVPGDNACSCVLRRGRAFPCVKHHEEGALGVHVSAARRYRGVFIAMAGFKGSLSVAQELLRPLYTA